MRAAWSDGENAESFENKGADTAGAPLRLSTTQDAALSKAANGSISCFTSIVIAGLDRGGTAGRVSDMRPKFYIRSGCVCRW